MDNTCVTRVIVMHVVT